MFKQSVNLTKQAQQIDALLGGINPLTAGKKRDEVMALLHKWFPQMESFEGQLKKYEKTIRLLEEENAALAQKAAANSENIMKNRLEMGKLQSDIRELRRFVDSIPPDMRAELEAEQKRKRQEHGKAR